MKALFDLKERKWNERKLRKPMNEVGLNFSPTSSIGFSPISSIDFRNFLSFHFLSTKSNTPEECTLID
jgi:hypothetical protein